MRIKKMPKKIKIKATIKKMKNHQKKIQMTTTKKMNK